MHGISVCDVCGGCGGGGGRGTCRMVEVRVLHLFFGDWLVGKSGGVEMWLYSGGAVEWLCVGADVLEGAMTQRNYAVKICGM